MSSLLSKKKLIEVLRRTGESAEQLAILERELPDPVDLKRDAGLLQSHGINRNVLQDRLGGSP